MDLQVTMASVFVYKFHLSLAWTQHLMTVVLRPKSQLMHIKNQLCQTNHHKACLLFFDIPRPEYIFSSVGTKSSYDLIELFSLYINDPGNADMVDNEEDMAGLEAMAKFLYDIAD
jgi:hypothetical protein